MTDHLSILQVKQLCVSALPADELAAAAVHTMECQSCHHRFVQELTLQGASALSTLSLEPEFCFRNDHVDFEQLVAVADRTIDHEIEEIIDLHLQSCETCRGDVRDFLDFRETSAGEVETSYGPTYYTPNPEVVVAPWWHQLRMRPKYAVAAVVVIALMILVGIIGLNRRSGSLEASKRGQTNGERIANTSLSPQQNATSSFEGLDGSAQAAVLNDSGGEVTIYRSGRVTGLDQVSENTRQYVAGAALSERIEPTELVRHLASEQSGLHGNEDGPQRFRLLYPMRSVVIDDRPVFRWEGLSGGTRYRVEVLDAFEKQVVHSEELPPNTTQWRAPVPLRRGQIFSWVVTAFVHGRRVVAPSASGMTFAVLSTADLQELALLRKSDSHLARGVFYARAGLFAEAENEIDTLMKFNPESELARKLLESVQSMRARR